MKNETLDAVNQDPQLELAQLLLGKVAEESCLWVSIAISCSITIAINNIIIVHTAQ